MATLSIKHKPRRRRNAPLDRQAKPAPTQRENNRFLIILYVLFALGAAMFLWLIYAVLFI